MELVMLGSNAFAHIVEALILWMGMSQMYEARYKQVVTGLVIMVGHAIMFWVFLTGNIYVVTIVNNLIYILLIALLYNVSKRSAIFWAVIYNAMMAISELIMFFTARYIVGIINGFINNIINSFYDLLYYWNNMESASERNHLDDDKFSWIGVF